MATANCLLLFLLVVRRHASTDAGGSRLEFRKNRSRTESWRLRVLRGVHGPGCFTARGAARAIEVNLVWRLHPGDCATTKAGAATLSAMEAGGLDPDRSVLARSC